MATDTLTLTDLNGADLLDQVIPGWDQPNGTDGFPGCVSCHQRTPDLGTGNPDPDGPLILLCLPCHHDLAALVDALQKLDEIDDPMFDLATLSPEWQDEETYAIHLQTLADDAMAKLTGRR